jgi:hypothetical protein
LRPVDAQRGGFVPEEKVGERATIETADHPKRTDSPEYKKSREWLMGTAGGGCILCGGESDLSHPDGVGDPTGLQDHHGGGIYVIDKNTNTPVLVALNLFPMEWSEGWGADPAVISERVSALNLVLAALGQATYQQPITDTDSVMAFVDSIWNANVKLCAAHHIGLQEQDSKDANGRQAVGIHNIPFPIWAYQGFCNWSQWDMWAGTTGTIAVAPKPDGGGQVLHVSADARATDPANRGENNLLVQAWRAGRRDITLAPHHNLVRAAKQGGEKP